MRPGDPQIPGFPSGGTCALSMDPSMTAPEERAGSSAAPRPPTRPPILEPAPPTTARPHVTAAITAPGSAADS